MHIILEIPINEATTSLIEDLLKDSIDGILITDIESFVNIYKFISINKFQSIFYSFIIE